MSYRLMQYENTADGEEQLNCYINGYLRYRFIQKKGRWFAYPFDSNFLVLSEHVDKDQYRHDLAERLEVKEKPIAGKVTVNLQGGRQQ